MAIENIVNANVEILGLLLPQYQLVSTDAETGTLSFNVDGSLVMVNACNRSAKALDLTKHVLEKRGITRGVVNREVLVDNIEALTSFGKDIEGLGADVIASVIDNMTGERVYDEDVAVATIE